MITEKEVSQKIRAYRLQQGYRQETVAATLGYSRSTYSYKELGKVRFSAADLVNLSQFFGISLLRFLDPSPVKSVPNRQRIRKK